MTRNLPDDTSGVRIYDSSYGSQVTDRRRTLSSSSTPMKKHGRQHPAWSRPEWGIGDLGEALSALGEPTTFGGDHFQQLRQTGSTYMGRVQHHLTHSTCPRAWMWHANTRWKFDAQDPGN